MSILAVKFDDHAVDVSFTKNALHFVGQCRFEWVKNTLILVKTLLIFSGANILHRDTRKLCVGLP